MSVCRHSLIISQQKWVLPELGFPVIQYIRLGRIRQGQNLRHFCPKKLSSLSAVRDDSIVLLYAKDLASMLTTASYTPNTVSASQSLLRYPMCMAPGLSILSAARNSSTNLPHQLLLLQESLARSLLRGTLEFYGYCYIVPKQQILKQQQNMLDAKQLYEYKRQRLANTFIRSELSKSQAKVKYDNQQQAPEERRYSNPKLIMRTQGSDPIINLPSIPQSHRGKSKMKMKMRCRLISQHSSIQSVKMISQLDQISELQTVLTVEGPGYAKTHIDELTELVISQIPFFSKMNKRVVMLFIMFSTLKKYDTRKIVYTVEQVNKALFIVLVGEVKLSNHSILFVRKCIKGESFGQEILYPESRQIKQCLNINKAGYCHLQNAVATKPTFVLQIKPQALNKIEGTLLKYKLLDQISHIRNYFKRNYRIKASQRHESSKVGFI